MIFCGAVFSKLLRDDWITQEHHFRLTKGDGTPEKPTSRFCSLRIPWNGEVVRAGLRALQERDAVVERWLQAQVAPTYDAMQADPSRAIPVEAVLKNLRAHHAKRLKDPHDA